MDWSQRSAVIGELPRTLEIDRLEAWYNGNAYSVGINARSHSWDDETDTQGKRIPLHHRKPYQVNLARYIVDTTSGWLFGEGHFPGVHCEDDEKTGEWIAALSEAVKLPSAFLQAAKRGGKGRTAVVVFKLVEGYPRIEFLPAKYCKPSFGFDGESLTELRYSYKAPAAHFVEMGYEGLDEKKDYWYRCDYTENAEIHYLLVECSNDGRPPQWVVDEQRTITHNLGVLSAVWIKNLPSEHPIDGEASYECIEDLLDPVNTLTSIAYRSIKKLSDPTVAFENIADTEDIGEFIKLGSSSGNTLVSPGGLKLLEMTGSGQEAARIWAGELRQAVSMISRVTNPDPEKLSGAAQSGYAMRILYAPLIELVGELRGTYGPALVRFVRLMLEVCAKAIAQNLAINLPRPVEDAPNPSATIALKWGDFFSLTPSDKQAEVTVLQLAINAKLISLKTARARAAWLFDVEDLEAEEKQIEEEAASNPSIADLLGGMNDGQGSAIQPPDREEPDEEDQARG